MAAGGGAVTSPHTRLVHQLRAEADRLADLSDQLERAGNPAGAAQAAEDASWHRWAVETLTRERGPVEATL